MKLDDEVYDEVYYTDNNNKNHQAYYIDAFKQFEP